jgi:SAM-dependent methyltransferase
MHESVMAWVTEKATELGLRDCPSILEVGSYDVNGTVRPIFAQGGYVGVDIAAGPGVDRVVQPTELPFDAVSFTLVVSTEMLEHAEFPAAVLSEMRRVLKPGGTLLLTTRSEGFGYHNPPDYWRFSETQMKDLLAWVGFHVLSVTKDPQVPGVFAVAVKSHR